MGGSGHPDFGRSSRPTATSQTGPHACPKPRIIAGPNDARRVRAMAGAKVVSGSPQINSGLMILIWSGLAQLPCPRRAPKDKSPDPTSFCVGLTYWFIRGFDGGRTRARTLDPLKSSEILTWIRDKRP
jgi:hypothetical protein